MNIQSYLGQLQLPAPSSHKGQNGKVMIIGGSELFHAASKWSLDIASKFVDMVFYSSVPSNNELMIQAKGEFWNGIVVARDQMENYIQEADVILIGPGMTRTEDTAETTNKLLQKFPNKKWVVDAGALQMADRHLFNEQMIITPHRGEYETVVGASVSGNALVASVHDFSQVHRNVCVLLKGSSDIVCQSEKTETITGGNAGMTKGGTGDVLAGLVAALYCQQPAFEASVIASYINKKAGESLWQKVGPNFNASDLVNEIPSVLWNEWQS